MNYHPSFAARVRDLCYLGATNTEIAALLGVSVGTLAIWRDEYPEFAYAWKDGSTHADAKVAASLFKRAVGYEYIKWKETKDGKFQEQVHIPGDVGACEFWLTNRRPDDWQHKIEHTGANGSIIPIDNMTDVEAARRIAFALTKAMQILTEDKTRSIEHDSTRPTATET